MRQATDSLEASSEAAAPLGIGAVVGGRFRIDAELPSDLAGRRGTDGGLEGDVELRVYGVTDVAAAAAGGDPSQIAATWTLWAMPLDRNATDPESLLRWLTQLQALRHKNLIDIEAVGRLADFVFIVMERVDGKTLRAFMDSKLADGVGVSLKGATNLVAHVSNALEHASQLAAHGALNPALVWISRSGRVKVEGLGFAPSIPGLGRQGFPPGAPETLYVAPERLAGEPPSPAADVFSLGAMVHELLTGEATRTPRRAASVVVPGIPAEIDGVIERALARSPQERWPSPVAFKLALQAAAATAGPVPTTAPASLAPAPGGRRGQTQESTRGSGEPQAPLPFGAHAVGAQPVVQPVLQPVLQAAASPVSPAVAAVAAAGVPVAANGGDEAEERWLVQKGNLDFGPFSMLQIRAQIERGEILADHTILDNDSGDRCLVRDFPGLGGLVSQAHRRLEHARREHAERHSQNTQKKKSLAVTAIVTLVVVSVLGSAIFYVWSRQDTSGGHLASREEETEVETFLKGVKIGGLKATVRHGAGHHSALAGAASGGPADEFNNDAKFGDASKGLAQGDQTLDDAQIQQAMMANYRKLIPCIAHAPGVSEIALDFVIRGSGKVSAVRVNGQKTGALPACMLGRMQAFNFPKFDGPKTIASWSMSLAR